MRIQCYGSESSDYLALVKAKELQTVNTSNGIMKYWNDAGGNTPLVAKTGQASQPTFMESASSLFDKVWGILSLPQTPAGSERKTVVVASTPIPLAAFAAVGMFAFVLYKVGKK